MKKKLAALFTSLMLIVTMLVLVCGCSSYSAIKKAFEKEGYTESEAIEKLMSNVNDYLSDDYKDKCTIHGLSKGLDFAIIFEFKATKDMKDAIDENESLKKIVKDIENSDYVNGTCVLVNALTASKTTLEIFKNA